MKITLPPIALLLALLAMPGAFCQTGSPYERADWATPASPIDTKVLAKLTERGIKPANPCSDEVFLRRVYIDMIGTLPKPEEVRAFLTDRRPDKRAQVIEGLFQRDEFADYWAMKWCDILRVKSEFPINLWPNAVQAYHRWIRDAVRDNKPYDQMARELLTSSGSNFRVAPVNFYRAVQGRTPAAMADAVALTFMGTRADKWPEARRKAMAAFFSRISFKKTDEWKEEIVQLDPAPAAALQATFPDGTVAHIAADADPRLVFADWLLAPSNQWFARSVVNRVWAWVMGRGIIHEPDDIRPDNPPANPEVLAYLEKELVSSHYDLRHIFRLILNSRTYQQSSIPQSTSKDAEALFAQYPVRRLDAEVLIDALCWLGGDGEHYESPIPEPFTFIPEYHRTISLPDASITSSFLEMFGRPSRDTGLESERNNQPTDAQRLYLLNSSDVQRRLERSPKLRALEAWAKWNHQTIAQGLYVMVLSRMPTAAELTATEAYYTKAGLQVHEATVDLAWALVNSKEFLYRH